MQNRERPMETSQASTCVSDLTTVKLRRNSGLDV